eukprot:CAMPEP_0119321002 /NCGR_PEP_ID=MMETSP1333-20130426/54127_1 /TAXON_ID=418940 /ORGANISM="Scyphosphaera apsteinii, Strain RCC1455" /LENGTH=363 /DNA_ID=CAMNT_0007327857 /DNA_START=153 /DNA_END=1244 /DNA_ORIENTATION=-
MMAVTLPLVTEMLRHGICQCTPIPKSKNATIKAKRMPAAASACSCGCAVLHAPPVLPSMLAKQLTLLPSITVLPDTSDELLPPNVSYLQRCDGIIPRIPPQMAVHAGRRGGATYLGTCGRLERPWRGFRQLMGTLIGIDLSIRHLKHSYGKEALFIPRDRCPPYKHDFQVHHSICLSSHAQKLAEVRRLLEDEGVATRVLNFTSAVRMASQMKTFAAASIIVAGHDSGLTNILFARPGTLVIEITPYLEGKNVAHMQRQQKIQYGRNAFQMLINQFFRQKEGWDFRHVGVPTKRFGDANVKYLDGTACHEWGCHPAMDLAKIALSDGTTRALKGTAKALSKERVRHIGENCKTWKGELERRVN